MSFNETKMDAGEIEKGVEQQSAATVEWSVKETNEAEEASELKPSAMNTTTADFEPGGGLAEVTPKLGREAQDELLLVAKPSYPHPIDHSGTGGHLTMSSLDYIMNPEETLTWFKQQLITAMDWGARRMAEDGRGKVNKEGKAPALKPSTLKTTQ